MTHNTDSQVYSILMRHLCMLGCDHQVSLVCSPCCTVQPRTYCPVPGSLHLLTPLSASGNLPSVLTHRDFKSLWHLSHQYYLLRLWLSTSGIPRATPCFPSAFLDPAAHRWCLAPFHPVCAGRGPTGLSGGCLVRCSLTGESAAARPLARSARGSVMWCDAGGAGPACGSVLFCLSSISCLVST